VVSFLLTPAWLDRLGQRIEARTAGVRVFVAEPDVLDNLVGVRLHQGVMAVARVPAPPPLAESIANARRPHLVVALDGVTNPENLGVVARVAAGFSAAALLAGETSASPWLRRAVRASMGTVFLTPVYETVRLAEMLSELRENGVLVFGASPAGRLAPADVSWDGARCVVLGHEDRGLSAQVASVCDALIAIPMAAGVDSFNVGSAAAILLYEARRQRAPGAMA
jgi:23S rRNA (guanosine2251-2'-O)-methyltransferase